MIVDQSHGLHEGMDGGRSDERPAALLELFRQRDRLRGGRRSLRSRVAPGVRLVAPHEDRQRALACDEFLRAPGIVDDGFDLSPMANDALVLQQSDDVAPGEARDRIEIEIMEGGTKVLALRQDGAPAQSRLEAFEAQFLEQATIVADREAPFGIVVAEELRRGTAPAAAWLFIGADDRCAHLRFDGPDAGRGGHARMDFSRSSTRDRSEERRVGKECRSRWSPYH